MLCRRAALRREVRLPKIRPDQSFPAAEHARPDPELCQLINAEVDVRRAASLDKCLR